MATPKIIADFETQISSAISIGSTSFTILSILDDDGNTIPDGKYYLTVDSGSSNKEYFVGTLTGATKTVASVKTVNRQGTETSGAVRAHRIGANIKITDFATYKNYIDETSITGASNATTSLQGLEQLATTAQVNEGTATGSTGAALSVTPDVLLASNYNTYLPTSAEKTLLTALTASMPGVVSPYVGRSAPTGWLLCDGTAVSRSTYATLLAVIAPSGTFTVTIASPGVFTKTGHGYVAGDKLSFTTTGALPTGLAVATDYYVIAAGLTTDAFEVATTPGGSAVNTSGSQSGTHTVYASAFGMGDGSTTFNLPDLRSKIPVGRASSAPTQTLTFSGAQRSSNAITILDTVFPAQGQLVQLTTTGALPTGLSLATDYYIIRVSSTSISFATTQANANAGTAVVLSGDGSGINTMTFTNRAHTVLGRQGGEEKHGMSIAEMPAHTHTLSAVFTDGGSVGGLTSNTHSTSSATGSAGSDTPHNIMQPFAVLNYIIKF